MLTVVTPATSTRLTTVARARAMLGTQQAEDVKLGMLLDQASAAAAKFCRRVFAQEVVRESFLHTRTFCGPDSGLLLERAPVTAIGSITADGSTLDPVGYELDAELGAIYRLNGLRRYGWHSLRTEVTYTAGYTLPSDADGASWTLPADIERAVINLAAAYRSSGARDPLIKSESVEGIGSTSWWVPGSADTLPDPEAERLLRPYQTILLG